MRRTTAKRQGKAKSAATRDLARMVEMAKSEVAKLVLPVLVGKAGPLPNIEDPRDREHDCARLAADAWDIADTFVDVGIRRADGPPEPTPHHGEG